MAGKRTDPVEQGEAKERREAAEIEELEASVDISTVSLEDFKAATVADARSRHPFQGYPEQEVTVQELVETREGLKERPLTMKLSHIVAYTGQIVEDPSNKGVTAGYPEYRDAQGAVIRPSTERRVDLHPGTNRRVTDYESGGVSLDCVFDRTIKVAAAKGSNELTELHNVAIVSSPSARAQLMFEYNTKAGRVEASRDFKLADPKQIGRLRRVFEMIINPKIRLEENIRQTFEEMPDDQAYESGSLPIPEGQE